MANKKRNGDLRLRIAVAVIAVSVISYTLYHVSSLFSERITTVITGVSTETKSLSFESYFFRDEEVLYSNHGGVADYLVTDGTKVSKGDSLAVVYQKGTYKNKQTVRLMDSHIDILNMSVNSSLTLADIEDIKEDTADAYSSIAKMLSTTDTGDLAGQIDKLLLGLNRESVLTDEKSAVPSTLESLVDTREYVFAQGGVGNEEVAGDSGYFYSYVDGYEKYFTLDNLDKVDSIEQISMLAENGQDTNTAAAYGKLADSSEWKIVFSASKYDQAHFPAPEKSDGETYYNVRFTENGNVVIPMLLEKKIDDKNNDGTLIVLSTDRLPEGFVFNRSQSISVELSSVSGIYVPKSAVVREGNRLGVYILRGYVVHYRRIEPVYETDNYYLVSEMSDTQRYLSSNDLLITGGSNLFDGRILD